MLIDPNRFIGKRIQLNKHNRRGIRAQFKYYLQLSFCFDVIFRRSGRRGLQKLTPQF